MKIYKLIFIRSKCSWKYKTVRILTVLNPWITSRVAYRSPAYRQRMTSVLDLWVTYFWRSSRVFSVCLAYTPFLRIRTIFLSMFKKRFLPRRMSVCHRMPPYVTVLETYTTYSQRTSSVCQQLSAYVHTLAYASTIRGNETGPLKRKFHTSWMPVWGGEAAKNEEDTNGD